MGAGQRLLVPWKVWPRWMELIHCRLLVWGSHQWSGEISWIVIGDHSISFVRFERSKFSWLL